ncbi:MAG: hypothetical protein M1826_007117 [Phylliscum demangeonii]|nr:MAG: hypothetical protein M1826_007117 [Phylliscum demangeonii]
MRFSIGPALLLGSTLCLAAAGLPQQAQRGAAPAAPAPAPAPASGNSMSSIDRAVQLQKEHDQVDIQQGFSQGMHDGRAQGERDSLVTTSLAGTIFGLGTYLGLDQLSAYQASRLPGFSNVRVVSSAKVGELMARDPTFRQCLLVQLGIQPNIRPRKSPVQFIVAGRTLNPAFRDCGHPELSIRANEFTTIIVPRTASTAEGSPLPPSGLQGMEFHISPQVRGWFHSAMREARPLSRAAMSATRSVRSAVDAAEPRVGAARVGVARLGLAEY